MCIKIERGFSVGDIFESLTCFEEEFAEITLCPLVDGANMKQLCSVIVSFLLSLSLDALKSPCPCEARVKRPKGTWEREMGCVFI